MQKLAILVLLVAVVMLGVVASLSSTSSSNHTLLADGVGDSPIMP